MKNKYVFCSVFAGLFLIFTSCNNLYDSEISQTKQNTQSAAGKAVVSLSVNMAQARTIMPTAVTAEDITKVELLQDGEELATWNGLSALSDASVTIEYGTYDFTINLYTTEDDVFCLVQTGTLREFKVDENTTSLAFTTSYVDKGSLSVTVQWTAEEDGTSRIDRVDSALYEVGTGGAIGEEVSNVTLETSEPSKKETKYSVVTTASNVPNGSYYIVFTLYDSIYSGKDVVLNTVREIVKINGFKTSGTITLNKLNEVSSSDGDLAFENGALEISANCSDKLYLNTNTITFSATDLTGASVSDNSLTWNAQILYKGTDVNTLTDSDTKYYEVDSSKGTLTLNSSSQALPARTYQLYVTATRNSVTSSRTFSVTAVKDYPQFESSVALYNYSNSNYTYYLVEPENVSNTLPGEAFVTTGDWYTNLNFAFDKNGYFYYLDSRDVHSNNPVIYELTNSSAYLEDLPNSPDYPRGFMLDVTQDMAYGYGVTKSDSTYSLEVYQFSELLTEGKSGSYNQGVNTIYVNISTVTNFIPLNCAIDDNRLYVYGVVGTSKYAGKPYLIMYDISSVTTVTATKYAEYDLYDYIKNTVQMGQFVTEDNFSINDISVTDVYATEGKVYLLVKEEFTKWTTENKNIYARGTVIEVTPPDDSDGTCTVKHIAMNTNASVANTDISKMVLYHDSGYSSPVYSEASAKSSVLTIDGSKAITVGGIALCNTYFPNVYGVSSATEKYFAAPTKVIGIKPKKLVIADDGFAFYTDSDGFAYKNMNRVVTVDLEEFVIESVQTTKAEFKENASYYLKSDFTLGAMVDTGTYYDAEASGYWFESSGSIWHNITVGEDKGYIYLSINGGN